MARASRFSNLAAALRPPATPQGRPIRAAYEHNRSRGPKRRYLRQMSPLKRLGVVMDPIGAIHYAKDSTLAMLLAAQASGFALAYLELRVLLLRDGAAFGSSRALTVRPAPAGWLTRGEPAVQALAGAAWISRC